jgi:hypothetical protein
MHTKKPIWQLAPDGLNHRHSFAELAVHAILVSDYMHSRHQLVNHADVVSHGLKERLETGIAQNNATSLPHDLLIAWASTLDCFSNDSDASLLV